MMPKTEEQKAKNREYQKQYYKTHPDKLKKNQEYIQAHREEHRARVRRYGETHKEKMKPYYKQYSNEHKKERNAYSKEWSAKKRELIIAHYGGKCIICGDKNIYHLCIDHVNNDGGKQRKSKHANSFYSWIIENDFPDTLQILCHNHNMERAFYGTMTSAEFEK